MIKFKKNYVVKERVKRKWENGMSQTKHNEWYACTSSVQTNTTLQQQATCLIIITAMYETILVLMWNKTLKGNAKTICLNMKPCFSWKIK